MSATCECCVLSGRGLCDGPIIRPEESCRVCVCARLRCREASNMRRPYPTGACCALEGYVIGRVLSRVASVRCALFLCHRVAK